MPNPSDNSKDLQLPPNYLPNKTIDEIFASIKNKEELVNILNELWTHKDILEKTYPKKDIFGDPLLIKDLHIKLENSELFLDNKEEIVKKRLNHLYSHKKYS